MPGNDDVELVDALLDAGADIDAPGSVIGGLGPIADADLNWVGSSGETPLVPSASERFASSGAFTTVLRRISTIQRANCVFNALSPAAKTLRPISSAILSSRSGAASNSAVHSAKV